MHRPLILHITGDYPDPTRPPTTLAIKGLIDSLGDCDHVVVSLTRTADPRRAKIVECPAARGQRVFAIHHFGLPLGVGLFAAFVGVSRKIERLLRAHALEPDLVHSHRLTFDGIAGWLISRRRAIPHFISVRGEVESKVLRKKPTYRPLIRRVLADAQRVYYVSAWFRAELERLAPFVRGKARDLPNVVANTRERIEPLAPDNSIVAVANLDIYKKKGIDSLIQGFAIAAPQIPDARLEIVGGGSADSTTELRKLIAATAVADRIILRGPVPNADLLRQLPRALALALPSRNETFGMVYTEALFAGVPILYSRGTGIDGHLDGLDVGVAVSPGDTAAVARALVTLSQRNARFRAAIATASGELFTRFDRDRQVAAYMADVTAARAAMRHGVDHASQDPVVNQPQTSCGAAGVDKGVV